MEISPVASAGCAIGVIIGGKCAAGIKDTAFGNHPRRVLRNRSDVMSKLLRAGAGGFAGVVLRRRSHPALLGPRDLS